jgi:hypothetical protein
MGCVTKMAYVRKEKETVEMDYSLDRVWVAVQRVVAGLEWSVEQIDEAAHHIKAKTKAGYMSWSSVLLIDAVFRDEKTTRVSVAAETPVTTITSIVYFGQARQLINLFLAELAKQLVS